MKRRKRTSRPGQGRVVAAAKVTTLPPRAAVGLHSLPLEVWHIVLENAPKPTLLACSRLSRTWRELTLPHLFASIEIKRCTGNFAEPCEEFLDACPRLARYVRRLRLVNNARWTGGRPVVDRGLLPALLTRFPCLEEVCAHSLFVCVPAQPRPPDVPATRRLRKLDLIDCEDVNTSFRRSVDPRVLLDLASAVPINMINIELFGVGTQEDDPEATPPLRPLDPRSLQFEMRYDAYRIDRDASWVCDVLRAAFAPRCLTALRLGQWILGQDIDALRRLGRFIVHACARAMRHLSLPVVINSALASGHDTSYQPEFWRVLHLHRLDSIETFECSLALSPPGTRPDSDSAPRVPLSAVCVAIFALLPPTLRKVTIILCDAEEGSQVKSKRMLDLRALDEALEARAPVLETVRLVFRGKWYLLEFATEATKAMPKCKKRGMLEVVDWIYHQREPMSAP
ncbi:hypothetical protein FKP32DRAFT_1760346 [Trametes sanguinea]|nr:hypothetical protein FKP32DRAFT_1760346 [Trametes sanguinea]